MTSTWPELLKDPEYAAGWAVEQPFGNLALNVWSLRVTKGITQQQLAESAKMKQPRIADIERDEANPTLLTISRIAFALGVHGGPPARRSRTRRCSPSARAMSEAAASRGSRGRRAVTSPQRSRTRRSRRVPPPRAESRDAWRTSVAGARLR